MAAKYGLDKNISPIALDLAKRNGKLYGVPIWVRPMTIFYKKSLFDKVGDPGAEDVCRPREGNGNFKVQRGNSHRGRGEV